MIDGLDLEALIAEARRARCRAQATRAEVREGRERIKIQYVRADEVIQEARRVLQALQSSQNGR